MKKFKVEDGIVIFSEARGGSTWLMEILSNIPKTCINWEPLNVKNGVVPKKFKWGLNPCILENDKNSDWLIMTKKILSFSRSSEWTRKFLTFKKLVKSNIVITKFVRANLLIPYIIKNIKFRSKPILLLRHPIDICFSQIKTFEEVDNDLFKVEIPDCINNDRFVENFEFLKQMKTKLELGIAFWCINNATILNQKKVLDDLTIVFYSKLLINPKSEIKRIFNNLNVNISPEIIDLINFKKPSATTFEGSLIKDSEEQLYKNFKNLSMETKDKIQKIFDHFNFKIYDAYSPYPSKY